MAEWQTVTEEEFNVFIAELYEEGIVLQRTIYRISDPPQIHYRHVESNKGFPDDMLARIEFRGGHTDHTGPESVNVPRELVYTIYN